MPAGGIREVLVCALQTCRQLVVEYVKGKKLGLSGSNGHHHVLRFFGVAIGVGSACIAAWGFAFDTRIALDLEFIRSFELSSSRLLFFSIHGI